jgi:hypothetical protein
LRVRVPPPSLKQDKDLRQIRFCQNRDWQSEAKGKRRPRVILLHGRALEIIRRLLSTRREGKLFLNEDGRPWKRFAIANRFDRLHLALGIEALKEQGIAIPPLPRFNRRAYADKAALAAALRSRTRPASLAAGRRCAFVWPSVLPPRHTELPDTSPGRDPILPAATAPRNWLQFRTAVATMSAARPP